MGISSSRIGTRHGTPLDGTNGSTPQSPGGLVWTHTHLGVKKGTAAQFPRGAVLPGGPVGASGSVVRLGREKTPEVSEKQVIEASLLKSRFNLVRATCRESTGAFVGERWGKLLLAADRTISG